jgi:hypothetical protein
MQSVTIGTMPLIFQALQVLQELNGHSRKKQIFEYVSSRQTKVSTRTVQRCLKKLVNDGRIEKKGYDYSIPDKSRRIASLFGGHAFFNMWLKVLQEPEGRKQTLKRNELLSRRLVETFGVYMFYCFLEAAHSDKNIKSYEDRMVLLRSMIPLKYDMYYRFVELLRDKPFKALKQVEENDKDTLDLSEEIIAEWSKRLKKQYPLLCDSLESSAKLSGRIVG